MKKLSKLIISIIVIIIIICTSIYIYNNMKKKTIDNDNYNGMTIEDDYSTTYSKDNTINLTNLVSSGKNIKKEQNIFTINNSGDYYITGNNKAQIIIDAGNKDIVHLILDNVDLSYSGDCPIYVKNADKVIITVVGNNYISDTDDYTNKLNEENDATIFSKDDITFNGDGSLTINANYNNAIVSNDGLNILNANLIINSTNNGIKGKDYVLIENSNIDITCTGDGIKANNTSDENLGFITIKDGNYNISSKNDAIQAETIIYIENGNFNIKTTSNNNDESSKGIKAGKSIVIDNGYFKLITYDDSIHCNDTIEINNGIFSLTSEDDGIHADNSLTINGGNIDIIKSYEGIEASNININDGNISVNASDDGINAAGGHDQSSLGDRRGMNNFSHTTGTLRINGGSIIVNSKGDGLDSNGNIYINNGEVVVYGPIDSANGAIDYDGVFEITNGSLIASGASGMAQMPSNNSTLNSIMISFSTYIKPEQQIIIKDNSGNEIINYQADKEYNNLVISNEKIVNGNYIVYIDEEEYTEFTVSTKTTKVGTSATGGFGNKGPHDDRFFRR